MVASISYRAGRSEFYGPAFRCHRVLVDFCEDHRPYERNEEARDEKRLDRFYFAIWQVTFPTAFLNQLINPIRHSLLHVRMSHIQLNIALLTHHIIEYAY